MTNDDGWPSDDSLDNITKTELRNIVGNDVSNVISYLESMNTLLTRYEKQFNEIHSLLDKVNIPEGDVSKRISTLIEWYKNAQVL